MEEGVWQEVRRINVQLTDLFDYTFDQNKDDDKTNDYLAYKAIGWWDKDYWVLFADNWQDDNGYPSETQPTIQFIADLYGWDGVSPIEVYAELDLRYIEVNYITNGYENENDFEIVQSIAWTASPYASGLRWFGYTELYQTDDWGNEIDDTMTCGDILIAIDDTGADSMYIYIDFEVLIYTVYFEMPNGDCPYEEHAFTQEISFPTIDMTQYPGQTFVGWYTEPNGGGDFVDIGAHYNDIEMFDTTTERTLYAYFVPSIGGSSVSSMSVLDEVVSSIQTASAPALASSAAPVTRSLASAAQAASKPQNAVTAALQLASVQTATPSTLADATYAAPASALVASDATLAPSFYPVATNATCAYETIAKSTAKTTVCPAQTLQAALVGSERREA